MHDKKGDECKPIAFFIAALEVKGIAHNKKRFHKRVMDSLYCV
jgi:hypothetical protein